MMQFYKKRDFGALISDTFNFVKLYGKNYFKNYFVINGLLLILMMVLVFFGFKNIFSLIFEGIGGGNSASIGRYFLENIVQIIFTSLFIFLVFILISVVNYSYPVLYLKRLTEMGNKNIAVDEIMSDVKKNIGKIFKLFLGFVFIVFPLYLAVYGLSYTVTYRIQGLSFLLLIFLTPVMTNVVNFLIYDYFNREKGFFSSLSYAIRSQFSYQEYNQKSPFWKYWGTTVILYILQQVVVYAFVFILVFIVMLGSGISFNMDRAAFFWVILMLSGLIYPLIIIISLIMSNFISLCSGFMYYDSRTDLHREMDLTEIDSIGRDEV
jgi:hypothetical protein